MKFLLALTVLLGLALAMAPAGSLIRNQATAVVDGQVYLSNEVETTVQAVCAPSLTPGGTLSSPGQRAITPAGGYAYFAYLLKNSGNDRFGFSLSWAQGPTAWSPASVKLFQDSNANSRRDSGEPEVTSLSLGAGEEVRLVLEVLTPPSASGDLPITPVATCPDGGSDGDNYSLITIGSGPALNLSKAVDQSQVGAGQELSFSLKLVNLGDQKASGLIHLSDVLNTPELSDLSYVAGSASAPKGVIEYSADATTWSTTAPAQVKAIRLVLSGLEPGEEAPFSFRMKVEGTALAGTRRNLARAEGPGGPAQAAVDLEVVARYAHALGPLGNPKAVGAADQQSKAVLTGQPVCFAQTLLNGGNVADTYTLSAAGLPSGVSVSFRSMAGAALPQPVVLGAGEQQDFQVCLSPLPEGSAAFTFSLSALSQRSGSSDATLDRVTQVLDLSQIVLRKSKDVGENAAPGERVIYTLRVENPLSIALNNVFIEDRLDPNLEFVSASDAGTYNPGSRMVRWNLAAIAAGTTLEVSLQTRVAPSAPDNTLVVNRFNLRSAEITNPLTSQPVSFTVLASTLLLLKQVDPKKALVGDVLTYTLQLANTGRIGLDIVLSDKAGAGLAYMAGSATLQYEGGSGNAAEPTLSDGQLVWQNLRLESPESGRKPTRLSLTYKMRVTPGAPETLENIARAVGSTAGGLAVATAVGRATVKLERTVFTPANLLVGRVFLDSDKDGKYTYGLDIPLPGARVVLAGGLQALTDAEGRYSFRNLAGGVWEVFLDPVSAPFPALPHPERLGDGYRHRVRLDGLTTSDFPLERPTGYAKLMRETTLEFGPLKVSKRLLPIAGGVRVVLVLSASETLSDLTLTDPLPGGGEKTFQFASFQGSQTLTYDLPAGYLTDPQARWRYP